MRTYATPEEVKSWLGLVAPPEKAPTLIRYASLLVESATINDLYRTNTDGTPSDAAVAEAFRDAVCTQVETWVALDIDPAKGAADAGKTVASKAIGRASISYATSGAAAEARARATAALTGAAVAILTQAGLGSPRPWSTPATSDGRLA